MAFVRGSPFDVEPAATRKDPDRAIDEFIADFEAEVAEFRRQAHQGHESLLAAKFRGYCCRGAAIAA